LFGETYLDTLPVDNAQATATSKRSKPSRSCDTHPNIRILARSLSEEVIKCKSTQLFSLS
jgi:hypothetical protein